jgi:anti-anti-sigma factor
MVSELHRDEASEPSFAAHSEHENGFAPLVLCGELDMATVPFLEQEFERAELTGSQVVALDLDGLTFIDVAGLRGLLAARGPRGADERLPALVGAPRAVRRVSS